MSSSQKNDEQDTAMQALRKLLFEQESTRIAAVEELLKNPDIHACEVSKVLAEAVKLRSQQDDQLTEALSPVVEGAIQASILKNPKPLSDALFPVMGPAIRKAINHAIASMLQSLNQTLEHAFSAKSIRWRMDAMRTGKSFAEIVLLNTLVYRVEQVFWIHKETGLLLQHASFDPELHEDADLVSSMLTAVRDFIHDSFSSNADQEVQSLRLGDLIIMLEQGPDSVLAVVCRGNPPQSLYESMGLMVESIQQEFHKELKSFDGDTGVFEASHESLSSLLLADYVGKTEKKSPMKLIFSGGAVILALLGWMLWSYEQRVDFEARWQAYIQQLHAEPGIVVTDAVERQGVYTLSGLRDPLSQKPESMLAAFDLSPMQVNYQFQPYYALQKEIVLKHVQQATQAPTTVTFALKDGVLSLSGQASQPWVAKARQNAWRVVGVEAVNTDDLSALKPLLEEITDAIKPPESVQLHLHGSELMIDGEAEKSWLATARKTIQQVQGLSHYDDHGVVVINALPYVLKVAIEKLKPPKGVSLVLNQKYVLQAKGLVLQGWIDKAQGKVRQIRYIAGFDVSGLKVYVPDSVILQRAIKILQPPAGVQLRLDKGLLTATGKAPQGWIDQAQEKAVLLLQGVDRYEDSLLTPLDRQLSPWQQLQSKMAKVALISASNQPMLTKHDKVVLKRVVSIYQKAQDLRASSRIQVSMSYAKKEKLVASLHYDYIMKFFAKSGVEKSKIDTQFRLGEHMAGSESVVFTLIDKGS